MRQLTPGDFGAVASLMRDLQADLGYRATVEAGEIRDWVAWADLGDESWLFEDDGGVTAFGWVFKRDDDLAEGGGYVHPNARGRGLGSQLVERSEAWTRRKGLERMHVIGYGRDDAAHALFRQLGYGEVRRYYEMELELDGELPEPVLPDGVRIEPFELVHARAFFDATDEAFRGEWGWTSMTFDEWRHRRVDGADTSLYFSAWEGDEIVAAIRGEVPSNGWIGTLGVRPAWRRRGLGEALLLHAFREMRRRGLPAVRLGVDAQNPTGATRLYERVGMSVVTEDVVYEKMLA